LAACNNTPLIALARAFIVISLREREQAAALALAEDILYRNQTIKILDEKM
jgi:hypothetical protein